jgi:hypothetical protein
MAAFQFSGMVPVAQMMDEMPFPFVFVISDPFLFTIHAHAFVYSNGWFSSRTFAIQDLYEI